MLSNGKNKFMKKIDHNYEFGRAKNRWLKPLVDSIGQFVNAEMRNAKPRKVIEEETNRKKCL